MISKVSILVPGLYPRANMPIQCQYGIEAHIDYIDTFSLHLIFPSCLFGECFIRDAPVRRKHCYDIY